MDNINPKIWQNKIHPKIKTIQPDNVIQTENNSIYQQMASSFCFLFLPLSHKLVKIFYLSFTEWSKLKAIQF